jgi:hypothetical protein
MGFFGSTVAAHLAGRTIAGSLLVFMDFKDAPRRWWPGFGPVVAGGFTWQGTGELIQVEGLDQPQGTGAPQTTFTLSGIDAEIVTLARNASDRVKNRRVTVFVQFFQLDPTDANVEAWSTLDSPAALWTGRMDQMQYRISGTGSSSVTVTAESLWVNRSRPAFGLFSDADQKARFPGDRGLEQVADLVSKSIRWPVV